MTRVPGWTPYDSLAAVRGEDDRRQGLPTEEWRPVPGFPSYSVSNRGRVVSTRRWRGIDGPRELAGWLSNQGYRVVMIRRDGIRYKRFVHRLVMEAFAGPCPADHEVRHLDGVRDHNVLTNLAYGTHHENLLDMGRHGTHNNGRKTRCRNGHPFDAENTYYRRSGTQRDCRICMRERASRSYYARRANAS